MDSKSRLRTGRQLALYHGLVNQIRESGDIRVDFGNKSTLFNFARIKNARYLLKALDLNLPIKNKNFPDKSSNKISFSGVESVELSQHIYWLKELLWANGIPPFDEEKYLKVSL